MSIWWFCTLLLIAAAWAISGFLLGYTCRKNTPELTLLLSANTGFSTLHMRNKMKKISTAVLYFIASLLALSPNLIEAAIDGSIQLVSSDPSVLAVTPLPDGTFRIDVVGPGECQLTASGDADLGDGIKTIHSVFNYLVYDSSNDADHFELTATQFIYRDAEQSGQEATTGDAAGELQPAA